MDRQFVIFQLPRKATINNNSSQRKEKIQNNQNNKPYSRDDAPVFTFQYFIEAQELRLEKDSRKTQDYSKIDFVPSLDWDFVNPTGHDVEATIHAASHSPGYPHWLSPLASAQARLGMVCHHHQASGAAVTVIIDVDGRGDQGTN